ncbi:MAG: TonB-dependent receptor [Marinilabiliaceae bacterium]|jgi:iron complex outermembrane receptor protein|nr:TonB-dependent receptor [Marinilabiliaceae bacterium]
MVRFCSILFFTFFLHQGLFSQKPDTLVVNLDEVIIRENRIRVSKADKAAPLTIIGAREISDFPVSDLAELLHFNAGIDIRTRGVKGIQNDLSIRGASFDQVLVLLNGIKINDPQSGHHNLNLPLDINAIERIEIYRGSSARVFGQNAFAGAINIITGVPAQNGAYLKTEAGEYSTIGAGAGLTFGSLDFRSSLSFNHNKSDGYRYNTDYRLSNVFYQSDINTNAGRFGAIAGLSLRKFGANGFYASPDYTDQYEEVNTGLASLSFNPHMYKLPLELSMRTYLRTNRDDYIFIRQNPEYYRNLHKSRVAGFDLNMLYKSSMGLTGLGLEISTTSISSNRLGEHHRSDLSIFLDHRFELAGKKIIISPGVQWILRSDFESRLLPGIDFGLKLNEKYMLYINSGYTYRVPTYTDLYYEDPVNAGNPDLLPEYALSNEIGIKSRRMDIISLQAGIFNRIGSNMIDRVKEKTEDKWMPVNINTVVYNGLELSMNLSPANLFNNNIRAIKDLSASYTYINSYVMGELPVFSRWEYENLRHQFTSSVSFSYTKRLSQTINFRYYSRVNMDNYALLDTRIRWNTGMLNIFIDISNISNTEYRETNFVPMPGRFLAAGINYNFKFNTLRTL